MCSAIKRPLVGLGSRVVHKRSMTLINAVYEQRYFNMLQHVKAKPEVQE